MKKRIQQLAITFCTVVTLSCSTAFAEPADAEAVNPQPAAKETPVQTTKGKKTAAYEDSVLIGGGTPFIMGCLGTIAVVGGIVAILLDSSCTHAHGHCS